MLSGELKPPTSPTCLQAAHFTTVFRDAEGAPLGASAALSAEAAGSRIPGKTAGRYRWIAVFPARPTSRVTQPEVGVPPGAWRRAAKPMARNRPARQRQFRLYEGELCDDRPISFVSSAAGHLSMPRILRIPKSVCLPCNHASTDHDPTP